ncbi:MAG TPA: hypothetical protein VFN50_09520 [Acidimicrobiales bacterium]|nr:hypothetical protein [Acidimicrobiales bacterium]
MGELPGDARRVVDELRSTAGRPGGPVRTWVPSASFEATLADHVEPPVQTNSHLAWLHANWDFSALLEPPDEPGIQGVLARWRHRAVMAVLGPYLERLRDYLGVNARAADELAVRVDDLEAKQLRILGAVRHDLVDFACHVDEQVDG